MFVYALYTVIIITLLPPTDRIRVYLPESLLTEDISKDFTTCY